MKVAASTSHRIHLTAEQAVCECYPLGFTDIQLGLPHYQANLGVLNKLRDKLGLHYTVHAPFPAVKGFTTDAAADDKEFFNKSQNLLLTSLDNAKEIGATVIVVHCSEPGFENSIESALKMFKTLSDKAAENSQTICIENKMPGAGVGYEPTELLHILNEVGSDNLGLCFDTGHAIASLRSEKKALEFFESLSEWIRDVHIVPGTYEWDVACPPQMEPHFYRGVVEILDKAGYEGNLTIEAVPEIPNSEILRGSQYLRATIAEYYQNQLF